ncbi:MAG: carbon starvation protein A, partial [Candidatus Rokubacteria bacterium]|nr:carbon starvation protein A [Candidatus Rokubacteria bacterium]
AVAAAVIYAAAVTPMPKFTQPVLWTAFFPTYAAILLVLIGALLTPVTGIGLQQPAFKSFWSPIGPLWPILFVAIACGAISGWHSLVGSSVSSKQLDLEPDAHPIGAGAMLSEGLLALISLAAYMVLVPGTFDPIRGVEAWVMGTTKLTSAYLGGEGFFQTYFGAILVLYALSLLTLVVRVWRLAIAELLGDRMPIAANKHVATLVALAVCWVFVVWGSWVNLWIFLGSANQLMAGLALMIISVHLARIAKPTLWSFIPACFMIVTTLSAIAWTTLNNYLYKAFILGQAQKLASPPINQSELASQILALILLFVGAWLFYYGLKMAVYLYRAYFRHKAAPVPEPSPVGAR